MAGGLLAWLRLCRLAPLRAADGARTEPTPAPTAAGRDRAPLFPWRRGRRNPCSRGGSGGLGRSHPCSHGGGGRWGWSHPCSRGGGRAGTEPSLLLWQQRAGTENSHGCGRKGRSHPPSHGSGGGDTACLLLPRQAGAGVPHLPHGLRGWQHGAPSSLPRAVARGGKEGLAPPPVLPAPPVAQ